MPISSGLVELSFPSPNYMYLNGLDDLKELHYDVWRNQAYFI